MSGNLSTLDIFATEKALINSFFACSGGLIGLLFIN